jgi:hypothetical protein
VAASLAVVETGTRSVSTVGGGEMWWHSDVVAPNEA